MIRRDRTERLARQVADLEAFDPAEARRSADGPEERAVIEQLVVLAAARDRGRTPAGRPRPADPPARLDLAGTLLTALGTARVAIGILSFATLAAASGGWPEQVRVEFALVVAFFGTAAGGLLAFSRHDPRARELGIIFLVVTTSFANGLHGRPVLGSPALSDLLRALPADAFLACAFWRFVRVFPGAPTAGGARFLRIATLLAGLAGLVLFAATATAVYSTDPRVQSLASGFARISAKGAAYWAVNFGALIPALVTLTWRTWTAGPDARRRGWLFLSGLLLGLLPLSIHIVLETISPAYHAWSTSLGQLLSRTARAFLLTIPLTTTYAVVFSRVLDVRVIIRRTLQYTFARATLTVATLVPFGFFVRDVYLNRDLPIATVFSSDRVWIMGLLVLGGFALLRSRGPILTGLDRVFFRNTYDPGEALARILDEARQSRTLAEAAGAAADRMMATMGLSSAAILVKRSDGTLVPAAGGLPSLSGSSALAALTAVSPSPLYVDLERPGALRRLPDDDLFWLSDTGTRALVPVHGSSGELRAVIALGPTRSEEPLEEAHGTLIAALGAGFAAPLERLATADGADRPLADSHPARECASCGRIAGGSADACQSCGGSLATAAVPRMLAGKFEAERVIGHGGMGVVYRAIDTTLGRPVAIKTLPRVSMEQVVRLRREARTMATFTHPNLATLFGLETWRGTPMLIVEYLEGGTLADRLHRAPISLDEWLPVGVSILDALAHIHERGILHRDLKPSNIGFNGAGAPKLLDFGLAELVDGLTVAEAPVSSTPYAALLSDRRIGTPVYMSPEAARGETPGTHFDLWSFAVVMLEALSGRLLYPTAEAAIRDLPSARIPDWRQSAPHLPGDVAALLDAALAPDLVRRPQSAGEFKQRLGAIAPTGRR
jgi:hypothetical protein